MMLQEEKWIHSVFWRSFSTSQQCTNVAAEVFAQSLPECLKIQISLSPRRVETCDNQHWGKEDEYFSWENSFILLKFRSIREDFGSLIQLWLRETSVSKSPFILLIKSLSSDPTSSRNLFWQPPAGCKHTRITWKITGWRRGHLRPLSR